MPAPPEESLPAIVSAVGMRSSRARGSCEHQKELKGHDRLAIDQSKSRSAGGSYDRFRIHPLIRCRPGTAGPRIEVDNPETPLRLQQLREPREQRNRVVDFAIRA